MHSGGAEERLPAGTPAAYQDNPEEIAKHVYGVANFDGSDDGSDLLPPEFAPPAPQKKSKPKPKKNLTEFELRQQEMERWQEAQKRLEKINKSLIKGAVPPQKAVFTEVK